MIRTLEDLLSQVSGAIEQDIRATYRRTNLRIRDTIRSETGLSLKLPVHTSRASHSARVPVKFSPACPVAWKEIKLPPEVSLVLLLNPYRDILEFTVRGTKGIREMKQKHSAIISGLSSTSVDDECLSEVEVFAEALLERIKKFDPLKWIYSDTRKIREVDDDIFGIYKYWVDSERLFEDRESGFGDHRSINRAEIQVFWAVIGLFAPTLGCTPSDLSIVIVTHELAHAYTQLGADIEGYRWHSSRFRSADHKIKEGLAQYYTHKVLNRLSIAHGGQFKRAFKTFNQLLKYQPAEYSVHSKWLENNEDLVYNQEAVRLAMLEERRHGCGRLVDFENYLSNARDRLSLQS